MFEDESPCLWLGRVVSLPTMCQGRDECCYVDALDADGRPVLEQFPPWVAGAEPF